LRSGEGVDLSLKEWEKEEGRKEGGDALKLIFRASFG